MADRRPGFQPLGTALGAAAILTVLPIRLGRVLMFQRATLSSRPVVTEDILPASYLLHHSNCQVEVISFLPGQEEECCRALMLGSDRVLDVLFGRMRKRISSKVDTSHFSKMGNNNEEFLADRNITAWREFTHGRPTRRRFWRR
jgi:hypothetical protein